MTDILPIETHHDGREGSISAWLVLSPVPILIDPGPSTVMEAVHEGLAAAGISPRELRYIAATHAHLDHAGSAGAWIHRYPHLKLLAHEGAAQHLVAPRRLVASTRITFGEAHSRLWGEVVPVPAHAVAALRPGERGPVPGLPAVPTPGHIDHHMSWVHEPSGTLVAGDALGIILEPEAPTHPASPPPSLDPVAWRATLDEIDVIGPEAAAVAHFGLHTEVGTRTAALRAALAALEARAAASLQTGSVDADARAFHDAAVERLAPFREEGAVAEYFDIFSAANDFRGMVHYLERRPPPP